MWLRTIYHYVGGRNSIFQQWLSIIKRHFWYFNFSEDVQVTSKSCRLNYVRREKGLLCVYSTEVWLLSFVPFLKDQSTEPELCTWWQGLGQMRTVPCDRLVVHVQCLVLNATFWIENSCMWRVRKVSSSVWKDLKVEVVMNLSCQT